MNTDGQHNTSRSSPDWARWYANSLGLELLEAEFLAHEYERHIHETYALGVTVKGVQRFWCRGATHESTSGNVIFINPGDAHDGKSGTDAVYAYRMLYIPVKLVRSFVQDAAERPSAEIVLDNPVLEDPLLADHLNSAWEAIAYPSSKLAGEELLTEVFARLAEVYFGLHLPRGTHQNDPALLRVRDYLHAHVEDNLHVGELAAVAEMGRFSLTRQFQKAFGLPLHAYHIHLKLEEAKRRLLLGVPIVSVAIDLGFADQSHFHRRFKGAFGVTPYVWRRAVHSSSRSGAQ